MSDTDPTAESGEERAAGRDDEAFDFDRTVESVCHNCGDWTTQVGDREELAAAAEEAAAALAGPTLTERQALAYLLRAVMDADREIAADVMDSTPSNVDNLQRRATEKVTDARRVVDGVDALQPGGEAAEESTENDTADESDDE